MLDNTQDNSHPKTIQLARATGLWYLALAVTGMVGFLFLHDRIFVTDDPVQTMDHIIHHQGLARVRLLLELGIIVSQAGAAVWFFRLFKPLNEWAAWAIGIWGMMNAAAIMVSAIAMASTIDIAMLVRPAGADRLTLVHGLMKLMSNAWGVGGLFFGLWLLPMGYTVIQSGRMPVWLGRALILGGIGYLLQTMLVYAGIKSPYLSLVVVPATIGEFWMIGYLLIYGMRPADKA